MPAFTLYGWVSSSNTDRVRLTLAEAGFTDYEFKTLNLLKGEQKVGLTSLKPNICLPFPVLHLLISHEELIRLPCLVQRKFGAPSMG